MCPVDNIHVISMEMPPCVCWQIFLLTHLIYSSRNVLLPTLIRSMSYRSQSYHINLFFFSLTFEADSSPYGQSDQQKNMIWTMSIEHLQEGFVSVFFRIRFLANCYGKEPIYIRVHSLTVLDPTLVYKSWQKLLLKISQTTLRTMSTRWSSTSSRMRT